MNVLISVDIEEEIRSALAEYVTAYVRPLPENFTTPSVLIELMGGTSENTIDTFLVRISSRAKDNADALELLRAVLGILQNRTNEQIGELRFSTEQNSKRIQRSILLTITLLCARQTANIQHGQSGIRNTLKLQWVGQMPALTQVRCLCT